MAQKLQIPLTDAQQAVPAGTAEGHDEVNKGLSRPSLTGRWFGKSDPLPSLFYGAVLSRARSERKLR